MKLYQKIMAGLILAAMSMGLMSLTSKEPVLLRSLAEEPDTKEITLNYAGIPSKYTLTGDTVKEALHSLSIYLEEGDCLNYSLLSPLRDGMELVLLKKETGMMAETEVIPFSTEIKENPKKEKTYKNTVQEGIPGTKEVIYETLLLNGTVIQKTKAGERTLTEPQTRIVEQGTMDSVITASGETIHYSKALTMTSTAYCSCKKCTGKEPGDKGYGITSSGTKAERGTVAVNTKQIPYGTKLYVEGYGFATAEDTGGAIKKNRIDLFMESHEKALQHGRKKVTVYILE